jgi:hypothetical protein
MEILFLHEKRKGVHNFNPARWICLAFVFHGGAVLVIGKPFYSSGK